MKWAAYLSPPAGTPVHEDGVLNAGLLDQVRIIRLRPSFNNSLRSLTENRAEGSAAVGPEVHQQIRRGS
jgi:hypothetical protein